MYLEGLRPFSCAFPPQTAVSNCPKAEVTAAFIRLGVRDRWRVLTPDAERRKSHADLKSNITSRDFSAPAIANAGS